MAEAAGKIFGENTEETKGENAHMATIMGAMAISDLVKTTLGPKGMDKILLPVSGADVTVTNDGATIMRALVVDNPAAKVLIDISKTQDDEVGDGTTSVCVLAGELLRQSLHLLDQKIHPQTIIQGWREALKVSVAALNDVAVDNGKDKEKFEKDLLNIARTTLSSKLLTGEKDHFAKLAVDAVLRLRGSPLLDHIQILQKPGGSLRNSYLEAGIVLDKKIGVGQPKRIENAKIMVANTPMDTDKVKIYSTKVKVDSISKVAEIEAAEKAKMHAKCEKILAHGLNVFINRQLIYNAPEEFFAEHNVMAIEHADFDGIERLALATGAEIVSTFDHPELVTLGLCDVIEEVMIGEDKVIRFSGCKAGEACTIVLRGASSHVLAEAERSLHDALCVLVTAVKETRTVLGAGCSESIMANAVDQLAAKTAGKQAIAMEGFAKALRQIPTILADNAGYDSAELVARLRAEHSNNNTTCGLNMETGEIGDVRALGITESFAVKLHVLTSAVEAAEMILRVDDVIKQPPRPREGR